jgi:flagellar biosynthesis GTPase FlhF
LLLGSRFPNPGVLLGSQLRKYQASTMGESVHQIKAWFWKSSAYIVVFDQKEPNRQTTTGSTTRSLQPTNHHLSHSLQDEPIKPQPSSQRSRPASSATHSRNNSKKSKKAQNPKQEKEDDPNKDKDHKQQEEKNQEGNENEEENKSDSEKQIKATKQDIEEGDPNKIEKLENQAQNMNQTSYEPLKKKVKVQPRMNMKNLTLKKKIKA